MAGDTGLRLDTEHTTTSDYVTGTERVGLNKRNKLAMDPMVLDSLDHAHYKVHNSEFFTLSKLFNIDASSTAEILLTTSTRETHLGLGFSGAFDFRLDIVEGVTITSVGTTLTAYNNNRQAPTTTVNSWYSAPVGATLGTTIFSEYVPGGIGPHALGGSGGGPVRSGSEWVLAKNQKYVFRVLNYANTTSTASMIFNYYESNGGN